MDTVVGINYLQAHKSIAQKVGLPDDKVIVNKDDWEEVVGFLLENPQMVDQLKARYPRKKKR